MLVKITGLLNPNQLQYIGEQLVDAPFVDGLLSAGKAAEPVKHNEELDRSTEINKGLNSMVMGALYRHPVYQHAALPHRVSMAFFARYTEGMSYGDHVDNSIMGEGDLYRSDVATTVFLNDPDCYEGGELTIETAFGAQQVKLAAGDAVLYPASSLHRVTEVTQGERLVAVAWTQSLVRSPDQRAMLYDLAGIRDELMASQPGSRSASKLEQTYANLVRMWAEV